MATGAPEHEGGKALARRIAKIIGWIFAALLGLILLLVTWGAGFEPRYLSERRVEVVELAALPAAWDGQRVVQLSDWQLGMWLDNGRMIDLLVDEAVKIRPAAVLLTGDFIYHSPANVTKEARRAAAFARRLSVAGIPTFAVLGNHDWGVITGGEQQPNRERATLVIRNLEDAGVVVLRNEAAILRAPGSGAPLYVVGLGSWAANDSRPELAFAEVPDDAARIVMIHDPVAFPELAAGQAPLTIAGHTHGGQVRLPFTPDWSWWSLVGVGAKHVDGWVEDSWGAPGNHLYINRGIGMSRVPIRINCPPELTVFVLRRAGDARARD